MGNNHPDKVDRFLRRALTARDPTDADLTTAEQVYRSGVVEESEPVTVRRLRPVPVAAGIMLMVVVLIAVQVGRVTPAAGALIEIADAARFVDPLEVPQQGYAYTQSQVVTLMVDAMPDGVPIGYLLPTERETWIGTEGFVQIRTTVAEPVFFTTEANDAYYQTGLDRIDRVGETYTETFSGVLGLLDEREWPTDPAELSHTIRSLPGISSDADIIDVAIDLIRESLAPPELRAAVLELMATLNLRLVEQTEDKTTFEHSAGGDTPSVYRFTLSSNGQLLEESETLTAGDPQLGIPSGTEVLVIVYQPTVITANLQSPT